LDARKERGVEGVADTAAQRVGVALHRQGEVALDTAPAVARGRSGAADRQGAARVAPSFVGKRIQAYIKRQRQNSKSSSSSPEEMSGEQKTIPEQFEALKAELASTKQEMKEMKEKITASLLEIARRTQLNNSQLMESMNTLVKEMRREYFQSIEDNSWRNVPLK
jgi:hypothetical protein